MQKGKPWRARQLTARVPMRHRYSHQRHLPMKTLRTPLEPAAFAVEMHDLLRSLSRRLAVGDAHLCPRRHGA